MNDPSSHEPQPYMIITCGLTGTGKSTIMEEVAKIKGFTVLASDVIRKQLAGISPEEHRYEKFHEGIYSKEFTEKTYLRMIEEGEKLLMQGKSVVLDACFPKKWQRQKALEGAEKANASFLCIEFKAPEDEVKTRLTRRFDSKEGISDGRWEIYLAQKDGFEAVDEFDSQYHVVVSTVEPKERSVKRIIERLES